MFVRWFLDRDSAQPHWHIGLVCAGRITALKFLSYWPYSRKRKAAGESDRVIIIRSLRRSLDHQFHAEWGSLPHQAFELDMTQLNCFTCPSSQNKYLFRWVEAARLTKGHCDKCSIPNYHPIVPLNTVLSTSKLCLLLVILANGGKHQPKVGMDEKSVK